MLPEIFEMFYAKVRARQYLQYIINIVLFKNDYLPMLTYKNEKVFVMNDISYYYGKRKASFINRNIFKDIVYNPRTYLYDIDKMGNYALTPLTTKEDFKKVINTLNEKVYKNIYAKPDMEEVESDEESEGDMEE